MKLIIGLGNPGIEYEESRHNTGFKVIDEFADFARIELTQHKFQGLYGSGMINGEKIILFKPLTYMNNSGDAVLEIVNFLKIDVDDIVVIYDEMAFKPGTIKLRLSGSSGGHKGMQSIIENLKTENIKRIRVGIGEPDNFAIDFVLGKPSAEDRTLIKKAIENASLALKEYLFHSFSSAMSKFNGGDNG